MPRRAAAPASAPIEPDRATTAALVQQVINKVMLRRQEVDRRADRLRRARRSSASAPARTRSRRSRQSIKALTPVLEVRSRRVGGATYQVPGRGPRAPRPHARRPLAGRVRPRPPREVDGRAPRRTRSSTPTSQQGGACKRKDDIYRMAQANKAFAHYRW